MRQVLLLIAVFCSAGPDWLQFRGSKGSGLSDEKGLPVTWSSAENIVWRTKLPGPGTSSPIVVGKRVYLTCYSGYGLEPGMGQMSDLMRHLVCIDRASGAIVWTKDFKPSLPESTYDPGNNSQHGYSSSTPASDGQRLYLFLGKSGVYCLDLDGKEIWHANVGTNKHGWGSSNSPVLFGDLVFINASVESNSLIALNKDSGKEVWRASGISQSWNTPVLVDVPDGQKELVLGDRKRVLAFDPLTGKELWYVTGFDNYVCPSVVADKGIVYAVRGGVVAVKAGGRGDVSESHVLWRAKLNSLVPSPTIYQGHLYWAAGPIFCLDASTGKEVFRRRLDDFYASVLIADGRIYCLSRKSATYVLSADAKLEQLARNRFDDDDSRSNASPIAHDGCLLLRTDRYLYCIGRK